jgi:hypothetical protein
MAKTWVLDTETKGTGAEMVPLEKLQQKLASKGVSPVMAPKPKPRVAPAPAPHEPWKFKVVDVVSRRVLAEDTDVRATLEVLGGIRSIVDARVYLWIPAEERWELLTLDQRKLLWDLRSQAKA